MPALAWAAGATLAGMCGPAILVDALLMERSARANYSAPGPVARRWRQQEAGPASPARARAVGAVMRGRSPTRRRRPAVAWRTRRASADGVGRARRHAPIAATSGHPRGPAA